MQNKSKQMLLLAQQIRALSQNGLTYSPTEYDTERYKELLKISNKIAACMTDIQEEEVSCCYLGQKEYVTPKVDIRAVVLNEKNELLMVREQMDGKWSLPGGWADIGYSPAEVAVKEVKEETGLDVEVVRLLAVMDMSKHAHPAIPFYVYKFFILCKITGGEFGQAFDILDKGFFSIDNLPPLSLERVLPEQIEQMIALSKFPQEVYMD